MGGFAHLSRATVRASVDGEAVFVTAWGGECFANLSGRLGVGATPAEALRDLAADAPDLLPHLDRTDPLSVALRERDDALLELARVHVESGAAVTRAAAALVDARAERDEARAQIAAVQRDHASDVADATAAHAVLLDALGERAAEGPHGSLAALAKVAARHIPQGLRRVPGCDLVRCTCGWDGEVHQLAEYVQCPECKSTWLDRGKLLDIITHHRRLLALTPASP